MEVWKSHQHIIFLNTYELISFIFYYLNINTSRRNYPLIVTHSAYAITTPEPAEYET